MTRPGKGAAECTAQSRRSGQKCHQYAIAGTDKCRMHTGKTAAKARAEGQVKLELARWGLAGEQVRDPGQTLLQLMTQSAIRVELYSSLLAQAYEAAERLQAAENTLVNSDPSTLPGAQQTVADKERASADLQRIFNTGGVAALVGHTYAADKENGVFATSEALRGLVRLEAEERDRCAGMAAKAVAAGLAERQVRLAEQQGALVAEYTRGLLQALGHDPSDPAVMRLVSERLHAIAGNAA